jgi:hypothetical protein
MFGFTLVTEKKQAFELLLQNNSQIGFFVVNPEYFHALNFLYGRSLRMDKKGLFTISTGLNFFENMKHGEVTGSNAGGFLGSSSFKEIKEIGVGFQLHVQLFRTGYKNIAIGIDGSTNLNFINSNFSIALFLKLGNFELQKR